MHRAKHMGLRAFRTFQVGIQLSERVATIEVLRIPLLAFLKRRRLAFLVLCCGELHQRHLLGFQGLSVVGGLDVFYQHL